MMTKKIRALAAAGAGTAVLLASGATFALWQDTQDLPWKDVTTGNLKIDSVDINWDVDDIANHIPVPGDEITGTVKVDKIQKGTNLEAELSLDGITGWTSDDGLVSISASAFDDDTATITIKFDRGTGFHQLDQGTTISLANAQVKLTQVIPES